MWWAYFDVSALIGERALAAEPAETRARLGRTAYTFAHMPMIVAIVVTALGLKKVMEYVADTEHHELDDPLKGVALGALVCGVVVYLLAHVAFKWVVARELNPVRLGAAGLLLAAWAPLTEVPALGQLGLVAGVVTLALVVEAVAYAERRREIRDAHLHH
jgi:low temperature requirement protein LtrA